MTSSQTKPETPPPADLRGVARLILAHWLKLAGALAVVAVAFTVRIAEPGPSEVFLWRQDLPLLAVLTLAIIALKFLPAPGIGPLKRPAFLTAGIAAACALAAGLAAPWVFEGYTLSLDEFMADFDAAIFRTGQLMAPVDAAWRDYLPALAPIYTLQTPGQDFWASSYLPLNAAFRAAAGQLGAAGWLNPLWAAISVLALYGVGRRLWPERPGMALAAAALMATSAQFVITAMTAYAMSAHLALNLVWLWLFLRGGRVSDIGALGVGFVACGLHQVIFHPLFVAPFILELLIARRWGRAAVFTAAYAAIGLFWIAYWGWLFQWVGVSAQDAEAVGGGWFAERVLALFANVGPGAIGSITEGLVRFISWQSLLAIPLATIGAVAGFRTSGTARALALGIVLTIIAMGILVPDQTHGWGYRYLHGFIGSVCLLAVFGVQHLTTALAEPERRRASGAFTVALAASILVLLPIRAWQSWSFNHPHAALAAAVRETPADVVLIDDGTVGFDSGGFVRNDPLLREGPKVMRLAALSGDQIRALCSRYEVAVIDGMHPAAKGVLTFTAPWADDTKARRDLLAQLSCG